MRRAPPIGAEGNEPQSEKMLGGNSRNHPVTISTGHSQCQLGSRIESIPVEQRPRTRGSDSPVDVVHDVEIANPGREVLLSPAF